MDSEPAHGRHAYVIFGAAIKPDGTASGTLVRRVQGALAAAEGDREALFIPSGAQGRYGPAEADVMAEMLRSAGVPDERMILDRDAFDTLDTVRNVLRILANRPQVAELTVCSSNFHNPRCATLFRLAGQPVRTVPMPPDRPTLGTAKFIWFCLREIPAILWDAFLVVLHRYMLRDL